jgi:hypothetical protein
MTAPDCVRVTLSPELFRNCRDIAIARDRIKLPGTDRRVSQRPAWAIHFDGLRAECAVAQYLGGPELVSFSVEICGDGGTDMNLGTLMLQVKASSYLPPLLRFDPTGSQRFRASVAALAFVPSSEDSERWVDLYGWIWREEFMRRAERRNFGYGERLVVGPPLHPLHLLSMLTERIAA